MAQEAANFRRAKVSSQHIQGFVMVITHVGPVFRCQRIRYAQFGHHFREMLAAFHFGGESDREYMKAVLTHYDVALNRVVVRISISSGSHVYSQKLLGGLSG